MPIASRIHVVTSWDNRQARGLSRSVARNTSRTNPLETIRVNPDKRFSWLTASPGDWVVSPSMAHPLPQNNPYGIR